MSSGPVDNLDNELLAQFEKLDNSQLAKAMMILAERFSK
jgi:hypothetical protein